ncbi:hypothetical protein C8Q70DRAFT_266535 [Cubamyces menziesii]|nr:hypothetical protein C8Q70DRAFT_266535 [Cubamyces menziesii]
MSNSTLHRSLQCTLLDIPLFVELPVADYFSNARHLLLLVSLRLFNGSRLQAKITWNEVPPLLPQRIFAHTPVYIPTIPHVHTFFTPNIFTHPFYIMITDLPGLTLPRPLLMIVSVTEWFPGDPSSMEAHVDLRYITADHSALSSVVHIPRTLEQHTQLHAAHNTHHTAANATAAPNNSAQTRPVTHSDISPIPATAHRDATNEALAPAANTDVERNAPSEPVAMDQSSSTPTANTDVERNAPTSAVEETEAAL